MTFDAAVTEILGRPDDFTDIQKIDLEQRSADVKDNAILAAAMEEAWLEFRDECSLGSDPKGAFMCSVYAAFYLGLLIATEMEKP